MKKTLGHWIEEFILLSLIFLNIIDFLGQLPAEIDYLKKIVSWAGLGYIIYRASPSEIFFGSRKKAWDLTLILGCFLMIIKNLVATAEMSPGTDFIFWEFYRIVIQNSQMIEYLSFSIAGLLFIILSLWATTKIKIKKPSIMHVIHEEGKIKGKAKGFIYRNITIFIVILAFFIVVFNIMQEWLAIALDSSLLVVALLFYIFTIFRRHFRSLNPDAFIYKLGNLGESFYQDCIKMLHSKEGILKVISGLLVLHLLTDIGFFLIPYITAIPKMTIYFSGLDPKMHQSLPNLLIEELGQNSGILNMISIFWIYILNAAAMIFLLLLPSYIWYKLYLKKGIKVSRLWISIFITSIIIFLLSPVFGLNKISDPNSNIVGVDIITHLIQNNIPLAAIFIISILTGIIAYILSKRQFIKKTLITLGIIIVDLFFGIYILIFFSDIAKYYSTQIMSLAAFRQYFILIYFILFLAISICFYTGGFVIFLIETKKEFKSIK